MIVSAISGGVASLMMKERGSGMAGFIGPLTAMTESTGSALAVRVLVAFVVVPLAAAFLMKLIFIQKTQLIKAEELKAEFVSRRRRAIDVFFTGENYRN